MAEVLRGAVKINIQGAPEVPVFRDELYTRILANLQAKQGEYLRVVAEVQRQFPDRADVLSDAVLKIQKEKFYEALLVLEKVLTEIETNSRQVSLKQEQQTSFRELRRITVEIRALRIPDLKKNPRRRPARAAGKPEMREAAAKVVGDWMTKAAQWLDGFDFYHRMIGDYRLVQETVHTHHSGRGGAKYKPGNNPVKWHLMPASAKIPRFVPSAHMKHGQQYSVWTAQGWVPKTEAQQRQKLTAAAANLETVPGIVEVKPLLPPLQQAVIRGDVQTVRETADTIREQLPNHRDAQGLLQQLDAWLEKHPAPAEQGRADMRASRGWPNDDRQRELRETESWQDAVRVDKEAGTVRIGDETVKLNAEALQNFFKRTGWEIHVWTPDPKTFELSRARENPVELSNPETIEAALRDVLPPEADVTVQPEYPGSPRLWAQMVLPAGENYDKIAKQINDDPLLARWLVPPVYGWYKEVTFLVPVIRNPLTGFTEAFQQFVSRLDTVDGAFGEITADSKQTGYYDKRTVWSINRRDSEEGGHVRFSSDDTAEAIEAAIRSVLPRKGRTTGRRPFRMPVYNLKDKLWFFGRYSVPAGIRDAERLETLKRKAMRMIEFGHLDQALEILWELEPALKTDPHPVPGNHFLLREVQDAIQGLENIVNSKALALLDPEAGFARLRQFGWYLPNFIDLDELMAAIAGEQQILREKERDDWAEEYDQVNQAIHNGLFADAVTALEQIRQRYDRAGEDFPESIRNAGGLLLKSLADGKAAGMIADMSQFSQSARNLLMGWETNAAPRAVAAQEPEGIEKGELWQQLTVDDRGGFVRMGPETVALTREAMEKFFVVHGWKDILITPEGEEMTISRFASHQVLLNRPDLVEAVLRDLIPVADISVARESTVSSRLWAQITVPVRTQDFDIRREGILIFLGPWISGIRTEEAGQLTLVTLMVPVTEHPEWGFTDSFRTVAAHIHTLDGGREPIRFNTGDDYYRGRRPSEPWTISRILGGRSFSVMVPTEVKQVFLEILPRGGRATSRKRLKSELILRQRTFALDEQEPMEDVPARTPVMRVLNIPDMLHYLQADEWGQKREIPADIVADRDRRELEKFMKDAAEMIELGLIFEAGQLLAAMIRRLGRSDDATLLRQVVRTARDLEALMQGRAVASRGPADKKQGVWQPRRFDLSYPLTDLDDMLWYLGEIRPKQYAMEDHSEIARLRDGAQTDIRKGNFASALENLEALLALLQSYYPSTEDAQTVVPGAIGALTRFLNGTSGAILRNRSRFLPANRDSLSFWQRPVERLEQRTTVPWGEPERILNYGGSFTEVVGLLEQTTGFKMIDRAGIYRGNLRWGNAPAVRRTVQAELIHVDLPGFQTEFVRLTIEGHPQIRAAANFFGADKDRIVEIMKYKLLSTEDVPVRIWKVRITDAAKLRELGIDPSSTVNGRQPSFATTLVRLRAWQEVVVSPIIGSGQTVWAGIRGIADDHTKVDIEVPADFDVSGTFTGDSENLQFLEGRGFYRVVQTAPGTEFTRPDGAFIRFERIQDGAAELIIRPPFAISRPEMRVGSRRSLSVRQLGQYDRWLTAAGLETPDFPTVMSNPAVMNAVRTSRTWSERIMETRLGSLFQRLIQSAEIPRAAVSAAIERRLGVSLAFADTEPQLPVIPYRARIRLSEGVPVAEHGVAAFAGLWPQVYLAHLPAFYNVVQKLKERHEANPSAPPAFVFEIDRDLFISSLRESLRHPKDDSLTAVQIQELRELTDGRESPDQLRLEDLIAFKTGKSFRGLAAERGAAVIHSQSDAPVIEGDETVNLAMDPSKLEQQFHDEPLLIAVLSALPFDSMTASILARGEELSVTASRLTQKVFYGLSIAQNGRMLTVTGGWAAYLRSELAAGRILVQSA